VTKKETNLSGTLSEAVSVATSVAYTRQEIQKLKTELVSLLEKKTTEVIVEQVPGPVGPRGALGATGTQGPKGDKGDKGDVGERGEKGDVGLQGEIGPEGLQGIKGDVGPQGEQGERGLQGEQGVQGIAGERGDKGEKGDRGADGQNGLDGRDGEAGKTGPAGPAGEQGIQGERGEKGDRGERGQDGRQGIQGSVGPRGEIGPQGIQGVSGKDGKDADIKPVEEKFQKFIDNVQKDVSAFKTKVNAVIIKSGGQHGGSGGSGEVNLRHLDDVDRNSIADGYVLSYDNASSKFVFVAQTGGGSTIDAFARTTANSAFSTANASYTQANTALSIAQSAFAQANTGGAAGTDNLARSIANSAFSTANSALSIAQSAFAEANTGGGATESLNVEFDNSSGVAYKVVALNVSANTVLASALDIAQVDKVLGVLDVSGETVTFGSITNPSWTWTPEQSLYLGSNGDVVTTSTINGAAFSLRLGYAISATKAFIKIGTPIVL